MPSRIVSLLFFSILIAACASPKIEAQDAGEIHLRKFEWMKSKDLEALEKLLHPNVKYIHSNGWIESKEDVIANIESGKLKYHAVEVEEFDLRQFGNTAIVVGKGIFKVELDENPLEIKLLYTEVYQNENGQWLLLSRHALRL